MAEADGMTLEQRVAVGTMPVDDAVRVAWGLCDKFEKSGRGGSLGDVSPQRVTLFGRTVDVRIPDGSIVSGFSAPERVRQSPTPSSDVYAMGALLVYALTGRPPDGKPLQRDAAHLQPIIDKCLAPNPAARFANLVELKRALVRLDKTLMSGPRAPSAQAFHRTSLGPWALEALLGQGSMGHVFKARHQALGRLAAIKVLRPEQYQQPELIQRFFQEARTVNQINHEHIVEISDFIQEPGEKGPSAVYCVMEFLQGQTLGDLLEAGPVEIARGLRIVEQVCDALASAHRVGVVHRDVKPDNIMLIERGGAKDYVKVLDFGVAKLTDTDGKAMVATTEGTIIGTPICMSPEQAQGDPIDARSDIWAIGVILYRLLAGTFPFDAPTFVNIAVQIITKPYTPLPTKTASGEVISPRLVSLVQRCLQKQREHRPLTMIEVRDEVRLILRGDGDVPRPKKRSPAKLALGVTAVVFGLLALGMVGLRLLMPRELKPLERPNALSGLAPLPPPKVVEDASTPEPAVAVPSDSDAGPANRLTESGGDAGASKATVRLPPPPPPKPVKLTRELVSRTVGEVQPKLAGCVAKFPDEQTKLTEQSFLTFEILKTGRVKDVKITGPVQGGAIQKCIAGVLNRDVFPPNDAAAEFSRLRIPLRRTE
jgi:serine/threonine-protein kinase